MELREAYSIIRRGAWPILLLILFSVGAALVGSACAPPTYRASATVLVHPVPSADQTLYHDLLAGHRLARTYAHMLTAHPIVDDVVHRLGLPEPPEHLAARVSAEWVADTPLIQLYVDHPHPQTAARVANALPGALSAYVDALQRNCQAESLTTLQLRIEDLARRIDGSEGSGHELGPLPQPAAVTEPAWSDGIPVAYSNAYSVLVQTYERTHAAAARTTYDVILFDRAERPVRPISPQTMTNAGLAALVGGMVGVGAAFLIHHFDDSLHCADDVEETTGLQTVGAIPRCGAEWEMAVIEHPPSLVTDAIQKLQANLVRPGARVPLRTVLVSSPVSEAGKTRIASNLAAAAAYAGLRVVLVRADLRPSRRHNPSKCSSQAGLTGALIDGHLEGKLQPTEIQGLRYLPAGESPANRAEVLTSRRVGRLLEELVTEADLVVVDSAPVLPVADAVIVGQQVDGVLLVVEVGRTRRAAAQEAVESLRLAGARVIGAVLNNVPMSSG